MFTYVSPHLHYTVTNHSSIVTNHPSFESHHKLRKHSFELNVYLYHSQYNVRRRL